MSSISKRTSFADIAVNAALILMSAAAAVLLCIYIFGGKASDDSTPDTDTPHVINASETEASQTVVTSVTETTVVSEETETVSETEQTPEIGEYSPAFFKNTLFIGDSLSVGLINYEFMPSENVFAKAGITPASVVNTNIDNVSVFTKAAGLDPEYICIMLGTNGIAYVEGQQMSEELGDFIDMIAETCPNAKIAISSVPPITQKHEAEKPEHLEAVIAYNEFVEKLAEDKSVAYADVFSLLEDETGYLGSRYAETDGLHLKIHAYPVILGAFQNALIDHYGIEFVPPPETETVSAAATVSVGTEIPAETATFILPETDTISGADLASDTDFMSDTNELSENKTVFEEDVLSDDEDNDSNGGADDADELFEEDEIIS